jgi:hypothetical protein
MVCMYVCMYKLRPSVWAYFSFIQHKSFKIICNLEADIYSLSDTTTSFKHPKLSIVQVIGDIFATNLGKVESLCWRDKRCTHLLSLSLGGSLYHYIR